MDEYTFPFTTCEKVNKMGMAQPYSALVNILNCIIILYFLTKTNNRKSFMLILLFLLFEVFHAFSHSIHIPGNIQINIIHILVYLINFTFFYIFYKQTNKSPSLLFLLYIGIIIILDLYALFKLSIVYYLTTQSLIFISLIIYYYNYLPTFITNKVPHIIITIFSVIILFLNEKYNCNYMLSKYKNFPFHILIEIVGIVFFYILSSTFYKL